MSESVAANANAALQRAAALLFIHAQTSLHPGSGTALGTVDLPVQRERHTQWPVIPGSTLKGIVRDACRRAAGNNGDLFAVFGPETAEASKHAGALSMTDARILAFPVRSLRGVFAWVTCPAVLERLQRDLKLADLGNASFKLPPEPGKDKALCHAKSPLLIGGKQLVLEEFEFERTGDADALTDWLAVRAVADEPTQKRLRSHLGCVARRRLHAFCPPCHRGRGPRRPRLRTQDGQGRRAVLRGVPAGRDAVLCRGSGQRQSPQRPQPVSRRRSGVRTAPYPALPANRGR